jgi:hypothetical protein
MGPEVLPKFRAETISEGRILGRFDPSPWAEENAIAGLHLDGGRFLWGRFSQVDLAVGTCSFAPDDPNELLALRAGESYPYLDSYYGERAKLVLDPARTWRQAEFRASDAVRVPAAGGGIWIIRPAGADPQGGELLPGGWDHEHCSICWERIGGGGQAAGFVSGEDNWVCGECYGCFVAPRSLAFVAWQTGFTPSSGP